MEKSFEAQSGNEASQFLCMFVLLVLQTKPGQPMPARIAFSIKAVRTGVGWVALLLYQAL